MIIQLEYIYIFQSYFRAKQHRKTKNTFSRTISETKNVTRNDDIARNQS